MATKTFTKAARPFAIKRSRKTLQRRAGDHWGRNVDAFNESLVLQMRRCGDNSASLAQAATKAGRHIGAARIDRWLQGVSSPRTKTSMQFLNWVELRYGLPKHYFRTKLFGSETSPLNLALRKHENRNKILIRWHLPEDFTTLPEGRQREILEWISSNILSASTEYGKYLSKACTQPFYVLFPAINLRKSRKSFKENADRSSTNTAVLMEAAPTLNAEIFELFKFKTSILAPAGFRRLWKWNPTTVQQKANSYGMLFGALAAPEHSSVAGFGVPLSQLTIALLAFPSVWDWFLEWCRKRRGFHTQTEEGLIQELRSLCRPGTGWLRQHPEFMNKVKPIRGLISLKDISAARRDWDRFCDASHLYAKDRSRELRRLSRVHRDRFSLILPVLNSKSPLSEYKKIADTVISQLPDENVYPQEAAEIVRSYLLLRFGMHLGLRQRNLRDLLVCSLGAEPRSDSRLEAVGCGEIRWNDQDQGWEVYIPTAAFKNGGSSFFSGRPYRVLLPNVDGLYGLVQDYLDRHRSLLLKRCADPGTFFVKAAKSPNRSAKYNVRDFYLAWRDIIQRYGIYNPYTGRGAIRGILPHGPHCVRDVLATHVLKETGSFDLAGYAIQDTAVTVARSYARFLPEDKSEQAAHILNKIWVRPAPSAP